MRNFLSRPFSSNVLYSLLISYSSNLPQTLGSLLSKEHLSKLSFQLLAKRDYTCHILVYKLHTSMKQFKFLQNSIKKDGRVHLTVDDIDAISFDYSSGKPIPKMGFAIGTTEHNKISVYNHIKLKFIYSKNPEISLLRILSLIVEPSLLNIMINDKDSECKILSKTDINLSTPSALHGPLNLTYSVEWISDETVSPIHYRQQKDHTHKRFLLFFVIIGFGILGYVWVSIKRVGVDNGAFDTMLMKDSLVENAGWKLVHGDVFRAPANSKFFITLLTAGSQLVLSFFSVFVNQLKYNYITLRRSAVPFSISLIITGLFTGYFGGRLYKRFSSGSRPFRMILNISVLLYALIFCTLIPPYTFLEFNKFAGFRKSTMKFPTAINLIPRQIPPQPNWLKFIVCTLIASLLPYNSIVLDLKIMMDTIWLNIMPQYSGYFLYSFIALVVTSGSMSILTTYLLLQHEDYRWWWKSFICTSGVSVYTFVTMLLYGFQNIKVGTFSLLCYFVIVSFLQSFLIGVIAGSIGFMSSFIFVNQLYSTMKIN
ncbi:hypothetical protein GJ496_011177 [Pomphorhynchus laevis]|nr:hypothetical protein GJ496_011177 [Pomphorhynchus laevis]